MSTPSDANQGGAIITPMQLQLALDFPDWTPAPKAVGASHAERWATINQLNPWIVPEFIAMARRAIDRGHQRIGVKWLAEVYRWERSRSRPIGEDAFKWNNNWTSFLARSMIEQDADLADFIQTRALSE